MRRFWAFLFLFSYGLSAYSQQDETPIIQSYRKQCLEVATYMRRNLEIECHYNYHHFNSRVSSNYSKYKAQKNKHVKIAEFNVLHPGMSKTRYKDYRLVAEIINQWDVVAVTELLPLISADLKHNQALVKFIEEAPSLLKKYEMQLEYEQAKPRPKVSEVKSLQLAIKTLTKDMKEADGLYRKPGYLKILEALHQLPNGKEWSLLLSPRGEAAKETDVQELVGFFYRSSTVKPVVNKFCKEIKTYNHGDPYACIATMTANFMGKDYRPAFSRRPFMASFESGNFSFHLLSSHVVYNAPSDSYTMSKIMDLAFGTDDPARMGTGINRANYARFAEVKLTLDFMQKLRDRLKMKNIILAADMNLESSNQFWGNTLKSFTGARLYSNELSSVSEGRFHSHGKETHGLANDYDHFIFSSEETANCLDNKGELNGGVLNFYQGEVGKLVKDKYLLRRESSRGPYSANASKYKRLTEEFLQGYLTGTETEKTVGIKVVSEKNVEVRMKGIVEDEYLMKNYIDGFYERILDSQLKDDTYYTIYKQVISDHMPIYMNCTNI